MRRHSRPHYAAQGFARGRSGERDGSDTLTLLRTPKPMRWMAPCLRSGSGGLNLMAPFFSTPRGAVTRTASPA